MAKAYLNIQVDASGLVQTVVRVVISDRPAWQMPDESKYRLWATVDEYEVATFREAKQEIRKRLNRATKSLVAFRGLYELLITEPMPQDVAQYPAPVAGGTCDSAVSVPKTDVGGG